MTPITEPMSTDVTPKTRGLLDRIDRVAADLAAEAVETEQQGKLTDRALALLESTGVYSALLAEQLGGLGLYPGEALPALERVAYIDGSIGWVNTIFASSGHFLDYLPAEVVTELTEGGMPIIGAVSNGKGTAVAVEGGFVVSGSYRYGSGTLHSTGVFAPAAIIQDGEPLLGPAGPVQGMFLVPTTEISFNGGWDTLGLRGTGSVDISFSDVFVPAARNAELHRGPIVDAPEAAGGFTLLIQLMHLGFATGITRRILDDIADYAKTPPTRPGASSVAENERFRVEYARHDIAARAARGLVASTLADIDETLRRREPLARRQLTLLMGASIHMHDVMRETAEWAFRKGGGVTLRNGTLQRAIRDALSGAQHFIVDEAHLIDVGHELLGVPDDWGWTMYFLGPLPKAA